MLFHGLFRSILGNMMLEKSIIICGEIFCRGITKEMDPG
jgi:hypothetical protein